MQRVHDVERLFHFLVVELEQHLSVDRAGFEGLGVLFELDFVEESPSLTFQDWTGFEPPQPMGPPKFTKGTPFATRLETNPKFGPSEVTIVIIKRRRQSVEVL